MKTDISRLDEKQRMLSTSRGLAWFGTVVVAGAVAIGAGFAECELSSEASEGDVRVVRASVTWSEGGRELSVVHVAEPVREAAPRVAVRRDRERRTRLGGDPSLVGREIRTGVSAMMMVVRLLAPGKMDR